MSTGILHSTSGSVENGATWEVWLKSNSTDASANILYKYGVFGIRNNSGTLQHFINSNNFVNSNKTITNGVKYHIVATYDNVDLKIYVNGALTETTNYNESLSYNDNPYWQNSGDYVDVIENNFLNGGNFTFYQTRIYGRPLTSAEVRSLHYQGQYKLGLGYDTIPQTDLLLWYDAGLKESYPGSGATWYDLSGNGNNGTIINGPSFSNSTFEFDGLTQYVNTNFTFSTLYTGGTAVLVGYVKSVSSVYTGHHNSRRWYHGINPNGIVNQGTQNNYLNSTNNCGLTAGDPYILIITFDGVSVSKLYVNNNLIQTLSGLSNSSSYSPAAPYFIGALNNGSITYADDRITACLMYDRELTADEMTKIYNIYINRVGVV